MTEPNKKNNDCNCSKACFYKVPVKLYVPIILELEVFAKNPICNPQGVLPVPAASSVAESDAASSAPDQTPASAPAAAA
jgi:hypothetical protein